MLTSKRGPSDSENLRGHFRSQDTRPDLCEGRVAGGRGVIPERGEAAVVRRPEVRRGAALRGFGRPVAALFGRLDAGIDRVDDADEDPTVAGRVLSEEREDARAVPFARELNE